MGAANPILQEQKVVIWKITDRLRNRDENPIDIRAEFKGRRVDITFGNLREAQKFDRAPEAEDFAPLLTSFKTRKFYLDPKQQPDPIN